MPQSLLSSEMLAKIVDGFPIPAFVINKQHKLTHWNTAIEALSGIKRGDIIGTDEQWRVFYKEKRPTMADFIVAGVHANEIEAYYPGRYKKSNLIDGASTAEGFFPDLGINGKWLHFTASPIRDDDGEVIGAIETLEDITERKNVEEALDNSEKRLRALFEGAHDAIWVHDLEGNIQTANEAAAELGGYPLEELLGMNVKSFISDESLGLAREIRDKLIQQQPVDFPYEQKLIKKDGSEAICMLTTNLITSDGEPKAFQNIARDVTQQKRMQENLRYYLQEITRAQEEERKRIARELHDDTAQVMGSLARRLDNFIRKKHGFSPNEVLFLKDLQAQLNLGVQGVHRFVQNLRPSLLDDLGLIPALRSLAKGLQESDGIYTELEVIGIERRFSPEVELLLFRIAQEALSNIRRHAQASEAKIIMQFTKDSIKVTIKDNGRGFELPRRLDDLPRSGKLGLAGIQERARLLRGTIGMESKPGKGTTLVIEVPS